MKIIMILLMISSLAVCQNQSENFIIVPFEKGLPAEIHVKWGNTLFSTINVGEYYKSLVVVSRDSLKTSDKCYLFTIVNENDISFTAISFEKIGNNIFNAIIPLKSQQEDKLSPLKLVLNLDERTLNYRWENRNNNLYEKPTINEEYPLKIGKAFPIVEVETDKGIWSNNVKNKIIVINWWATSCMPCVEEMPGLNELVSKYSYEKVEFIAICSDKENLSKFLSKYKFNYQQGFGNIYLNTLLGNAFPRHIIIDKKGIIQYNKLGGSKDIHLELEKIINNNL